MFAIGNGTDPLTLENVAEHAILGCAASAAEGSGCAGGALGAATSAVVTPFALAGIDPNGAAPDAGQTAAIAAIAMLAGGGVAGALGQNATAAATWAQNEALNNDLASLLHIQAAVGAAQSAFATASNSLSGVWNGVVSVGEMVANIPNGGPFASPGDPGYISANALRLPYTAGDQVGPGVAYFTAALATMGVGQDAAADAETEAIAGSTAGNALFRGTTEGYPGSPGLQQIGITPTSTSPVVATVFATGSGTAYGNGVLQIALPSDLAGVEVSSLGNASTPSLAQIENEFAVSVAPTQFASLASTTITATQARSILSSMGINIPNTITLQGSELTEYLCTLPTMSQAQISTFMQKAAQIVNGK